jgi:hypothetical protein
MQAANLGIKSYGVAGQFVVQVINIEIKNLQWIKMHYEFPAHYHMSSKRHSM